VSFQFDVDAFEKVARAMDGVRRAGFNIHRIPPTQTIAPLIAEAKALASGDVLPASVAEAAWRTAGAALRAQGEAKRRAPSARDVTRIIDVVRHIERELDASRTLAELAAMAGLSRFHSLRVFRQVVGSTPHQYLLARRLARAAALLRETDLSVLAIALQSGCGDLSEFTRRFKARFGSTPGAFRATSLGSKRSGSKDPDDQQPTRFATISIVRQTGRTPSASRLPRLLAIAWPVVARRLREERIEGHGRAFPVL
jgi:AraC-like DNA-binding protein